MTVGARVRGGQAARQLLRESQGKLLQKSKLISGGCDFANSLSGAQQAGENYSDCT